MQLFHLVSGNSTQGLSTEVPNGMKHLPSSLFLETHFLLARRVWIVRILTERMVPSCLHIHMAWQAVSNMTYAFSERVSLADFYLPREWTSHSRSVSSSRKPCIDKPPTCLPWFCFLPWNRNTLLKVALEGQCGEMFFTQHCEVGKWLSSYSPFTRVKT